jgi:hypothetical protein
MHRRTNRKQVCQSENSIDEALTMPNFFSDNFRNVYNDIQKTFPPIQMTNPFLTNDNIIPNILNFEANNSNHGYHRNKLHPNEQPQTQPPSQTKSPYSYVENDLAPISNNHTRQTQKCDVSKNSEKCGIKTLLNTRSKMTYPFEKNDCLASDAEPEAVSVSKPKIINNPTIMNLTVDAIPVKPTLKYDIVESVAKQQSNQLTVEKQLQHYIDQEVLSVEENFVETITENIIDQPSIPIDICYEIKETKETAYNISISNTPAEIPTTLASTNIYDDYLAPPIIGLINAENLSDIESRVNVKIMPKKIDIKSYDNSIVNTNSPEMNTNTENNRVQPISNMNTNTNIYTNTNTNTNSNPNQNETPKNISTETIHENPETKTVSAEQKPVPKPVEGFEWPSLTIKDINTTFKVIGDLKDGSKVKIVDDKCLAVDDAYFASVSRYNSGQSRERTMSFLDHLLEESKKISYALLADIRNSYVNSNGNNNDVNNKLSELRNMYRNLNVFLHKFDTMKSVYKSDTKSYAALSDIRNNFFIFEDSFYRELVLGSIRKDIP